MTADWRSAWGSGASERKGELTPGGLTADSRPDAARHSARSSEERRSPRDTSAELAPGERNAAEDFSVAATQDFLQGLRAQLEMRDRATGEDVRATEAVEAEYQHFQTVLRHNRLLAQRVEAESAQCPWTENNTEAAEAGRPERVPLEFLTPAVVAPRSEKEGRRQAQLTPEALVPLQPATAGAVPLCTGSSAKGSRSRGATARGLLEVRKFVRSRSSCCPPHLTNRGGCGGEVC